MTNSNLILDIFDEITTDGFAGGGGASEAFHQALGRHVDHANNHAADALGMHRINHPQTTHHLEDVFAINPRRLACGYSSRDKRELDPRRERRIGAAWFSPDCKHFSKAKGGKPLSKKIRGLAFVIFRWAKNRARVLYMENVEEIQTWGPLIRMRKNGKWGNYPDPAHVGRTWKAFLSILGPGIDPDHPDVPEILKALQDKNDSSNTITKEELVKGFGYDIEYRELRACDYGAPTIRKRLYLIGRCDGLPIIWPKPTHASPEVARALKLKPYVPVAKCIDWDIPCNSIFLTKNQARKVRCKRPLAKSSLRRIALGVGRHVLKTEKPFIFSLTHHGSDNRTETVTGQISTITGANRGEKAFVDCAIAPFITEHANASHQRNFSIVEPMRTLCAEVKGGHFALAAATMVKFRGTNIGYSANGPAQTISAGGLHHGLTIAKLQAASMVKYYGTDQDPRIDEPLHSVTTKDRFGLNLSDLVPQPLTEEQAAGARRVAAFLREHGIDFEGEFATVNGFVIIDIGMRMLTPRELFRAQGFPESYVIDRAWIIDRKTGATKVVKLSKTKQIKMCGNAVCPPVGKALIEANSYDISVWTIGNRNRLSKMRPTCSAGEGEPRQ